MAQEAHKNYPLVTKEQAQGIAWVFYGPHQEPVEYPFTFPELKPDEVRVQQSYFGLCYSDCHLANSDWFDSPYPLCPGHEILGRVVAKGADVHQFQLGDLVGFGFIRDNCGNCKTCHAPKLDQFCPKVDNRFTPIPNFGGFASHFQAKANWAFPIPLSIPENVCPPLLCAGITVFAPLKRFFQPNQECAVAGIGGLGHLAIMFASKLGFKTTAVSTSENKRQEALNYGATDFINTADKEVVKKSESRFDILLMTAHASTSEQLQEYISLLKPNGKLVFIGLPNRTSNLGVPFFSMIMRQIQVVGSLVGSREENFEMLEFAAKHKIYPVCEQFEFNDFKTAYNHLLKGQPKYRCVVKVGEAGNLKQ